MAYPAWLIRGMMAPRALGGGSSALAQQFLGMGNVGLGHQASSQALTQAMMGARGAGPMGALSGQLALGPGSMAGAGAGAGPMALGPGASPMVRFGMGPVSGPGAAIPMGGAGGAGGGAVGGGMGVGVGGMGAGGAGSGAAAGAAGGAGARTLGGILAGLKAAPKGAMALRGGLAGTAASLAVNPLIEKLVPGEGGQTEGVLKGAASGALVGGAIGSAVPIVGTGLGALIGGGGGALLSFLGGGKKKSVPDGEALKDAMADAGIDPQTGAVILNRYNTTMRLAESDEEKAQAYGEAKQLIIDAVTSQSSGMGGMGGPSTWSPEQIMAMQVQSSQLMQPYAQQANANAGLHAQLIGQLTQGMDPGVGNLLKAGAIGEITASQRLIGAYQAQAALAPMAAQWEQQTQMRDQISNQLLQQAIGQALSPQSATGGGLQDMLAQYGAG